MYLRLGIFVFVLIKYSVCHLIASSGLHLLLKSEITNKAYYISKSKANALVASSTCTENAKTLLSLETEDEFDEITRVLEKNGIESVWTSGIQTVTNISTRYSWVPNGKAVPMEKYVEMMMAEPDEDSSSIGEFLIRKRRETYNWHHGSAPSPKHPHCNCNDPCPTKPKCSQVNCTIDVPDCSLEDRECEVTLPSNCSIINQPNCTVTCPQCTLTRGECYVTRPPCVVTPGECKTNRENCHVVTEPCRVEKGKCSLIEEPCEVIQPEKPCTKPPKCSYNPNNKCAAKNEQLKKLNCTDDTCSIPGPIPNVPCSGFGCPTPEPDPCKDDCCLPVIHCVPDIVCQPPPVICKPPIYHCLPSEVICPPPRIECDDPITVCDPPIVTCPDFEKHCEPDIIVCPPPQTVCTPAVSHCTRTEFECSSASLHCEKPIVTCPDLPKCEIPPECYNPCPCTGRRHKRSIGQEAEPTTGVYYETEDVLDMKCLGIEQTQKWKIEKCEGEKWFVCEEN